ncbi:MAG: sulfatase [Candidatus Brocadiaceae bacterium]|jgi:arylsulfatase A-like enzyme
MPRQPNVVVLMTHDTGQHISPYGIDTVRTPNCERLASEGVLFENSFCTSPLCSPSRATCFTGRYNHQNGVMGLVGSNAVGGWDLNLNPDEKHAAHLFKEADYATVLCGNIHESNDFRSIGFDEAVSGSGRGANNGGDALEHGDHMERWLGARDPSRPFYMQIGTAETHRKWDRNGTAPDSSKGVWMPPYLRDLPEIREEMAQFQGAVRRYDTALGNMLESLEKHGLVEDTIFVSTTDHGVDIPRAKGTFYDPGIEVLLIMRYPAGGWGAGRRLCEMISNVDVLPTLLEACGLEVPDNVEGRSFLPLLRGGDYRPNQVVFAEKTYHDTYDPTRALRTERYKYIRYFEVCIFQDLRAATIPRVHWFKTPETARRRTVEELYDLDEDPLEENNVADDPAYAEVKAALRERLAEWMRETDDPLLEGHVSSPFYREKLEELMGAVG